MKDIQLQFMFISFFLFVFLSQHYTSTIAQCFIFFHKYNLFHFLMLLRIILFQMKGTDLQTINNLCVDFMRCLKVKWFTYKGISRTLLSFYINKYNTSLCLISIFHWISSPNIFSIIIELYRNIYGKSDNYCTTQILLFEWCCVGKSSSIHI